MFVDTDYLLNCIAVKLPSTTSKLGTFSPFFALSINFLRYQIISCFQVFVILAYIHLLF